jgi:Zn-dependent protease/CBS domain-containing protein
MMGGLRLGSIFGFEVRIDYSWFVIAFLILWSFAAGVFPTRFPELEPRTHLLMGIVGAFLFFASLLAHELSHSLVARRRGIDVEGITLFVFGGMAHTSREADDPEDELVIAGVGPLCSIAIGLLFGLIGWWGGRADWSVAVTGVAEYMAFLNVLLAAFNLLPGFPLDGGRLFRAMVWKATGDRTRATRWASNGGRVLGWVLITLGGIQVLAGYLVGGLWLVFIGWFLRTAAIASFHQHVLSNLLAHVRAADVMTARPSTVSPETSLRDLVDERLLRQPYQSFPVVRDGEVLGLVTLDHVRATPREQWARTIVADVMMPASGLIVRPSVPLAEVLQKMTSAGANRVLVARHGQLVGLISTSDIARWVRKEHALAELTQGTSPARRTREPSALEVVTAEATGGPSKRPS